MTNTPDVLRPFIKILAFKQNPDLSGHCPTPYLSRMRAQLSFVLTLLLSCFFTSAADAPKESGKEIFNGKDLSGWKKTEFGGEGEVEVKDGKIITKMGAALSG